MLVVVQLQSREKCACPRLAYHCGRQYIVAEPSLFPIPPYFLTPSQPSDSRNILATYSIDIYFPFTWWLSSDEAVQAGAARGSRFGCLKATEMPNRKADTHIHTISRLTAYALLLHAVFASPQQEQHLPRRVFPDLKDGEDAALPFDPLHGSQYEGRLDGEHYRHLKETRADPHRQSAVATLAPVAETAVRAPPAQETDRPAGLSSLLHARSLQDWEVEDILLLATVDGSIHARNRHTGAPRWALEVEQPMVETTYHRANESSVTGARPGEDVLWIVEPSRDGDIYIYHPGASVGLQRLRLTVRKLEELSPYAGEDPAVVYTTEKRTMLYTIDASTGNVRKQFSSRGASVNDESCKRAEGLANPESAACVSSGHLILGRTEYTIAIQDGRTAQPVCTLKYSEWGLNNRDNDLHSQYLASIDRKYVYSRHDGTVFGFDHSSVARRALFNQKLPSPVVRAFDVVRPAVSTAEDPQLVLLPQPVGPVERDESTAVWRDQNRIFVNQTDAGGWFALSESTYPSVTGAAPRAQCDNPDWVEAGMPFHLLSTEKRQKAMIGVHLLSEQNVKRDRSRLTISGPPGQGDGDGAPLLLSSKPHEDVPKLLQSQIITKVAANATDILVGLIMLLSVIFLFVNHRTLLRRLRGVLELRHDVTEGKTLSVSAPRSPVVTSVPEDEHFVAIGASDEETSTGKTNGALRSPLASRRNTLLEPPTPARCRASSIDDDRGRTKTGPRVRIIEPSPSPGPAGEDDGGDGLGAGKKKARRGCRGGTKHKKKRSGSNKSEDVDADAMEQTVEEVKQIAQEPSMMEPDAVEIDGGSNANDVSSPTIQIGHLRVFTDTVLGFGSHGTVVYKGSFGGRDVAVKRMLLEFYDIASHEVGLLQESDDHPNVIRYYDKESAGDFLYIALELCPASLQEVVEKPAGYPTLLGPAGLDTPDILRQITLGVRHLHSLKIVHRDIKPQNILLSAPKKLPTSQNKFQPPRLLISDFGLCKKLEGDQSSFRATTAHAAGTSGWRAPELLVDDDATTTSGALVNGAIAPSVHSNSEPLVLDTQSNRRATRAIDIFSLGCVFYYVLTGGSHPFDRDGKYMREANIVKDRYMLDDLAQLGDYQWEARHVVAHMLSHDPRARPDAATVLVHPFFWSPQTRLDFLCHVSDQFEWEPREPPSPALQALEALSPTLLEHCGGDFLRPLPALFKDTLGKQRKYVGSRVLDLLRALRNKKNHYEDMPEHVKEKVGPLPDGYLGFWTRKFPGLLMGCHSVVVDLGWDSKDRFRSYYSI